MAEHAPVPLTDLLDAITDVELVGDPGEVSVTAVTEDSREVAERSLYCCVPGANVDGHDLAADAVARGAVALVCERELPLAVPQVLVPSSRAAIGPLAARLHGDPSHHLDIVGVTGTNGKTTTVAILAAVLRAAGRPAATIGTLSPVDRAGVSQPPTTPGAAHLQARLASLLAAGTEAVAMEVSSHGLIQRRVDGTRFAVAVFTNLSRDHLDIHATMEDYFSAKAMLFEPERSERAVVNADDPHGRLLLDAARIPTRPYSLDDASDLELHMTGATFTWQGERIHLPLSGEFNVRNALAAATAALEVGVPLDAVAEGLASVGPIDGRFEVVAAGPPVAVIVDYAHTPDGIEQVLRAAREIGSGGRVVIVFGCGGDRDREKRPAMGEVASRLADLSVITSDNPRSEEPMAIIDAIRSGAASGAAIEVEPDRRAAIALALRHATDGDVVIVAGKGHETTQTLGDRTIELDDRVVVREELDRLRAEGEGR
ncbi:MAG TPA: UDP-N-acetylmuramoyl-L-alanyl-D-glutamate--2,6-diaminopimelate ligase [Acidimicrobiales bacterium]|nr:UDP-N-acetylmuramoyl-L-alanyl-D-glutamate--2,6-diaminopimelate ligase [Acidimicrobiales bacterium]